MTEFCQNFAFGFLKIIGSGSDEVIQGFAKWDKSHSAVCNCNYERKKCFRYSFATVAENTPLVATPSIVATQV